MRFRLYFLAFLGIAGFILYSTTLFAKKQKDKNESSSPLTHLDLFLEATAINQNTWSPKALTQQGTSYEPIRSKSK